MVFGILLGVEIKLVLLWIVRRGCWVNSRFDNFISSVKLVILEKGFGKE